MLLSSESLPFSVQLLLEINGKCRRICSGGIVFLSLFCALIFSVLYMFSTKSPVIQLCVEKLDESWDCA